MKAEISKFNKPQNNLKTDLKTNRNSLMIQELMKPRVNGMFLFYFTHNGNSNDEGFMVPPGLTDVEMASFKTEFMFLFERYARLANKRTI